MSASVKWLLAAALLGASGWGFDVHALDVLSRKSTVCTITVNSPNEKEMFRSSLPDDRFQFVELVERGRPDWLASACRQGVKCDVLVISGHFDAGTEFYSDRIDNREFLAVSEMERASCSDSCPGLFSQLKEVYLFGCNTLNAQTGESTQAEIARSLVRAGQPRDEAERISQMLSARHAESNRDEMRRIFTNVPLIYGFSSLAPLGPTAAMLLSKYFQSMPGDEFGSGRPSAKLLAQFGASSMTFTSGLSEADTGAKAYRGEVCQFFDERLSPAQRLVFIHGILKRDMAEVRMFFERIESFLASLTDEQRETPEFNHAFEAVARDRIAREKYLAFTHNVDQLAVRTRMIKVAHTIGWLSPEDQRAELIRTIGDHLTAGSMSAADVSLACSLNKDRDLDGERHHLMPPPRQAASVARSAVLACLGSDDDHARVLRSLSSLHTDDVQIAQVYLHHRPITDARDVRIVATGIARMPGSEAQIRALDTLARQYVSDPESLEALTRLYRLSKSVDVQRAIAGVFIRADHSALSRPELARVLRDYRRRSSEGQDVIDVLIRRLQAA